MLIARKALGGDPADSQGMWWSGLIAAEFESFQENRFNLVAETTVTPIGFRNEAGKPPQLVEFDNVALKFTFSEPDYWKAIARLHFTVQRLRSYLAVVAAQPVSMRYLLVGDRILASGVFDTGSVFGLRRIPGLEEPFRSLETAQQSARNVVQNSRFADHLMDVIEEGSPLDRALTHAGNALWVVDELDAFLHSWRTIDAVFAIETQRLLKLGRGQSQPSNNQFAKGVLDRLDWDESESDARRNVSERSRIGYTVFEHLGLDLSEDIDDLARVRRALAHGDVSFEEFQLIVNKLPRMLAIAYRVVCSALLRQVAEAHGVVEVLPTTGIPPARIEYEMDPEMTKRIRQAAREEYERRRGTHPSANGVGN